MTLYWGKNNIIITSKGARDMRKRRNKIKSRNKGNNKHKKSKEKIYKLYKNNMDTRSYRR